MTRKSGNSLGGQRGMRTRVKTAKGRKLSSTRWLERQLNDPYVAAAKKAGYRSRAAFKLLELDERFSFLKPGQKVVDLGAAPGGWLQVAVTVVGEGNVVGIDILPVEPVAGTAVFERDFLDEDAPALLTEALGGRVDLVLSDMAAEATGHRATDHIRIVNLVEAAVHFAVEVLSPGGAFVAKVFQGGTEKSLLDLLKRHFESVRHAKPKASRPESPEVYVVALGFKGAASEPHEGGASG